MTDLTFGGRRICGDSVQFCWCRFGVREFSCVQISILTADEETITFRCDMDRPPLRLGMAYGLGRKLMSWCLHEVGSWLTQDRSLAPGVGCLLLNGDE